MCFGLCTLVSLIQRLAWHRSFESLSENNTACCVLVHCYTPVVGRFTMWYIKARAGEKKSKQPASAFRKSLEYTLAAKVGYIHCPTQLAAFASGMPVTDHVLIHCATLLYFYATFFLHSVAICIIYASFFSSYPAQHDQHEENLIVVSDHWIIKKCSFFIHYTSFHILRCLVLMNKIWGEDTCSKRTHKSIIHFHSQERRQN